MQKLTMKEMLAKAKEQKQKAQQEALKGEDSKVTWKKFDDGMYVPIRNTDQELQEA